jgi:hypothetical protein
MTEGEASSRYEEALLKIFVLYICTLVRIALCLEFTSLKKLKSQSSQLIVRSVFIAVKLIHVSNTC